jgi:BirA family biotin operon repressor/biotin-[acetyl-CoA-carboxylase] ligase
MDSRAETPSLIDPLRLAARLGPLASRVSVELLPLCDSSNAVLLARSRMAASGSVVVCERQTSGRGRRGRSWLSSPRESLCLSLLWRFPPATRLAGLSLAVGVAIARALAACGVPQARLKWPNDVVLKVGDRWGKAGGVLIEIAADPQGIATVIGIGLNLELPAGLTELDFPAAAIAEVAVVPDRHQLLAALLRELVALIERFAGVGFAPLADAWSAQHAFAGQPVCLRVDDGSVREGIAVGVDGEGALLLDCAGRRERILAGDVSLRPAR